MQEEVTEIVIEAENCILVVTYVSTFNNEYLRNNKVNKEKNLLCFPKCSGNEFRKHNDCTFCGNPIVVKIGLRCIDASRAFNIDKLIRSLEFIGYIQAKVEEEKWVGDKKRHPPGSISSLLLLQQSPNNNSNSNSYSHSSSNHQMQTSTKTSLWPSPQPSPQDSRDVQKSPLEVIEAFIISDEDSHSLGANVVNDDIRTEGDDFHSTAANCLSFFQNFPNVDPILLPLGSAIGPLVEQGPPLIGILAELSTVAASKEVTKPPKAVKTPKGSGLSDLTATLAKAVASTPSAPIVRTAPAHFYKSIVEQTESDDKSLLYFSMVPPNNKHIGEIVSVNDNQIEGNKSSMNDSSIIVIFNGQPKKWRYDWDSNKHVRFLTHTFCVSVFYNSEKENQHVHAGHAKTLIGTSRSSAFQIFARRRGFASMTKLDLEAMAKSEPAEVVEAYILAASSCAGQMSSRSIRKRRPSIDVATSSSSSSDIFFETLPTTTLSSESTSPLRLSKTKLPLPSYAMGSNTGRRSSFQLDENRTIADSLLEYSESDTIFGGSNSPPSALPSIVSRLKSPTKSPVNGKKNPVNEIKTRKISSASQEENVVEDNEASQGELQGDNFDDTFTGTDCKLLPDSPSISLKSGKLLQNDSPVLSISPASIDSTVAVAEVTNGKEVNGMDSKKRKVKNMSLMSSSPAPLSSPFSSPSSAASSLDARLSLSSSSSSSSANDNDNASSAPYCFENADIFMLNENSIDSYPSRKVAKLGPFVDYPSSQMFNFENASIFADKSDDTSTVLDTPIADSSHIGCGISSTPVSNWYSSNSTYIQNENSNSSNNWKNWYTYHCDCGNCNGSHDQENQEAEDQQTADQIVEEDKGEKVERKEEEEEDVKMNTEEAIAHAYCQESSQ